jgi:integrase
MAGYEERRQPNGKLLIRVVVGYEGTKPLRKSTVFPANASITDITTWVKETKGKYSQNNGQYKSPDALVKAWLEHSRENVSPRTIDGYESFARLYILGRLRKLDADSIDVFLSGLRRRDGKPLAPKTRDKVRVMLKMILDFGVEKGYLKSAPKLPKSTGSKRVKDIKVFSIEQSDALRDLLRKSGEVELETLLTTGLRIQELLALEPKHVIGNSIQVSQALVTRWGYREVGPPKSVHSYRTININVDLAMRLNDLRPERQFLFSIGATGLTKRLNKYCMALGLPTEGGLHRLRHSHCTYLLAKGVPVVAVSRRLGHHSVGFTLDTYSHLIPSMDDALIKALG